MGFAQFQIVHNQAELVGAIDLKAGLGAGNHDFEPGPCARFEIYIGFVHAGLSFRNRCQVKSGCDTYWVEWWRRN